ncbi:YdcF family protein [Actinoplanes sp. TFC3]|uniref:YdcF family protein n=1 Tax=Actinoplanes sp. TFC3 TaxID=1710355 RepID=UPI000830FC46|nr:YdcF family protein [Actinoplanes sp. TFC3]
MPSTSADLNTLAAFLGRRDEVKPSDVLILFGGCPPAGWDLAAGFIRDGLAERLLLVGGEGHTTPMLRERVPGYRGETEADLMAAYLAGEHGITEVLLERESTNCGNNVTLAEAVLREAGMTPARVILVQDASMQLRMDAVFRQVWTLSPAPEGESGRPGGGGAAVAAPEVINYAGTRPRVTERAGELVFVDEAPWDMDHWISLLMGEIPRLAPDGYGPLGKGFLAHVDIPDDVVATYTRLRREFAIREPKHAAG